MYEEPKIKVPRFHEDSGFYTTQKRSRMMSRIRSKNSKPELILRKALWKENIRFRINSKLVPGRPDIAIQKYQLAIFVDGEFWHGYHWPEKKKTLKANRAFWIPKIERNMQRDREVNRQLQEMGFTVFRFWVHEIKTNLNRCVQDILTHIETFPHRYD
ncbi:MAG: very short patch repair endonuclease [Flavobacteriaceae bacterium]